MRWSIIVSLLSVVTLTACDTMVPNPRTGGTETHFIEANRVASTGPLAFMPPDGLQPPEQLRPLPKGTQGGPQVTGLKTIQAANANARQRSTPAGFINAVQYFDYVPGSLYEVYTAPGYVTTISLQPGEKLITYAAGDTVRWVIGDVTGGTDAGEQTHVLIKPIRPNLRTNLVITTDHRIYLVEARSIQGSTYNAAVGWSYPHEDIIWHASGRVPASGTDANTIARKVAIGDLNFAYEISGDEPRWRPLRAFDDGSKTYIEFPPNLGTMEAPPLFVIGHQGDAQLVNYRVKGRFYEIDRLIDLAELRLGENPQAVVRIVVKRDDRPSEQQATFPDGGPQS